MSSTQPILDSVFVKSGFLFLIRFRAQGDFKHSMNNTQIFSYEWTHSILPTFVFCSVGTFLDSRQSRHGVGEQLKG